MPHIYIDLAEAYFSRWFFTKDPDWARKSITIDQLLLTKLPAGSHLVDDTHNRITYLQC